VTVNRTALAWRGDCLHRAGQRGPVLCIKRDARWPTMWRIEWPDGRLSDMANRTRIRDAAVLLARAELECEAQARRAGASPIALTVPRGIPTRGATRGEGCEGHEALASASEGAPP
jgi:hypothetical protein